MQIEDFSLAGPTELEIALHPRLTIVRGCSQPVRHAICQYLPGAFYGFDVASKVRWIGRSGERHVVGPTDAIVPRLTIVHHEQLDSEQRILDLLTMAGIPDTARAPGLIVLDEPFADHDARKTWEYLEMLDRLSARMQMLLLTDDPCVTAWADHRQGAGTFCSLELQPPEQSS